ncbi:MAG TPA: universal stress protein [Anaerolineales bacterium]|nr:universal stress protein [Anaerolineales bacterium]
MNPRRSEFASALSDFRQARQQAALQEILARFTGKSAALIPFDEAYKKLKAVGMIDRGLKEIPVDAIVGSVNRYADFTRSFLPRHDSDAQRWATVKAITSDPSGSGLPPIEVYQIGNAYFVSDGNHRVSVAKQMGVPTVEAYVTELHTRVSLSASASFEELILKSEHVEFLERTRLDASRPDSDFTVTVPGEHVKLEVQIEAHQKCLAEENGEAISTEEAALRWYDEVYLPIVISIRDRGILRDFPDRTETDLYLFIAEHRADLEAELGWAVRPEAAAESLVAQPTGGLLRALADGPAPGQWRQTKLEDRYTDRLFADILVALNGEEVGWYGLAQALVVARREGSRIKGLYVVHSDSQKENEAVQEMRVLFDRQCAESGVEGSLAVEAGEVATTICNRALLADLVVLNLSHPPTSQRLARLSHGIRTIIRRCARPILAVPGIATPLSNALLAFDGSPKAKEALFVATYFAEQWKSPLVIATVIESDASREAVDFAHRYLDMHEVGAAFVECENKSWSEAILKIAAERQCDLFIMGGYGASPVVEAMRGSSVDDVLRESDKPMLICR